MPSYCQNGLQFCLHWLIILPFVKGKIRCLCRPPSSFFAGGNGPLPLGWTLQTKIKFHKHKILKTRRKQITREVSLHALQGAFLTQAMNPKPLQMPRGQMIPNLQCPTLKEAIIYSELNISLPRK